MNKKFATLDYLGNKYKIIFSDGTEIELSVGNFNELLNVIDYLLSRINTLYFMYNVVKNQSIAMNNYKDQKSKIND